MTDQIGRVLGGRYRLIAPIGTGASAQVYLADDVKLRRRVAVKVLHAALADDDSFLRRFRAEAQSAAALSHPHIVAVFDWDDSDVPYIVTEYLGGGSLRAMLDAGHRLTTSQALVVGLETSRALEYAHRRGLVHRDVKPANLLFGDDRRLRLADLGLARALAEAAWTEPTGAVLGTARYASPEQAKGEKLDGRSDVYALALVLVEAVTGSVPFAADTTIGTLMARVDRPLEVPKALGALRGPLERAGHPERNLRPDAAELTSALLATAEQLDRPEPLPIVGAIADADIPDDGRDITVLAGTTMATDDIDLTVTDGTAIAGATRAMPPTVPPTPVMLPDEPRRPSRRRRLLVVGLTVLLAALLGTGAGFAWLNVQAPTHAVPDLVGMTEAEAREAVGELGFRVLDVRRARRRHDTGRRDRDRARRGQRPRRGRVARAARLARQHLAQRARRSRRQAHRRGDDTARAGRAAGEARREARRADPRRHGVRGHHDREAGAQGRRGPAPRLRRARAAHDPGRPAGQEVRAGRGGACPPWGSSRRRPMRSTTPLRRAGSSAPVPGVARRCPRGRRSRSSSRSGPTS